VQSIIGSGLNPSCLDATSGPPGWTQFPVCKIPFTGWMSLFDKRGIQSCFQHHSPARILTGAQLMHPTLIVAVRYVASSENI